MLARAGTFRPAPEAGVAYAIIALKTVLPGGAIS